MASLRKFESSGQDLNEVAGKFDWVLANIIAPTLIELRPSACQPHRARWLLAPFWVLATQQDEVVSAMANAAGAQQRGLKLVERRQPRRVGCPAFKARAGS